MDGRNELCIFRSDQSKKCPINQLRILYHILQNGHSILMFPEGTRSKGEGIGDFKSGFVRIAKDGNVPIVPIAIMALQTLWKKIIIKFVLLTFK